MLKTLALFLCSLCIVQMIALDSERGINADLVWRCSLLAHRIVQVRPRLIPQTTGNLFIRTKDLRVIVREQ